MKYFCNCERYCKRQKEVSRQTYRIHAQYRAARAAISSSSADRNMDISEAQKRRRISQDNNNTSSSNNMHHNHDTGTTPEEFELQEDPLSFPLHKDSLETPQAHHSPNPQSDSGNQPMREAGSDAHETYSEVEAIRIVQQYIHVLRNACLHNGDLSMAAIEDLLNPPEHTLELDPEEDRELLMCLRMYIAQVDTNSSDASYTANLEAIRLAHPEDTGLYSHDRIKRKVEHLSGIHPIVNDMCPNSCMAYTGPFADSDSCLKCNESRYDDTGNPRQRFYTLPIGPQIQALKRDPQSASLMDYFRIKTRDVLNEFKDTGGIEEIDDFCCGTDILNAIQKGLIKENDTILIVSFDGCQLYRMKISDCWIYIWIIGNLSPTLRYKKKHVIPGAIIPGPNAPKIAESFLFPGLHHVAAINRSEYGGLSVWDAMRNEKYISRLFIVLGTADGPGMVHLNGLVGHSGKHGCRLWCGLAGRHKPGSGIYYPVLAKPDNFTVRGCDHDDIPYNQRNSIQPERYQQCVQYLSNARLHDYEKRRLQTGIVKPSIFSGLASDTILGIPNMFPGDIMHLILNLAELMMGLWRGTLDCASTDSKESWDWAVLTGDIWSQHGADVANCTHHLPGSFDRPPRNPAEKINSGYKAWEWLLYLFGLGPALLHGILPEKYWQAYCKMVAGVRRIYQRKIRRAELRIAFELLIEFTKDFEMLYYQRRADRIHFVRQSIHNLSHAAPEISRIGPGACSSQWTMERSIGNMTEEIKQDSNPYKNLSERAWRRAEINALKAMIPALDKDRGKENYIPRNAVDLGDGYVLLHPTARYGYPLEDDQKEAFETYLENHSEYDSENDTNDISNFSIVPWGRIRLPSGQIGRSVYKEGKKNSIRIARNVKIQISDSIEFAEVLYYFRFAINDGLTESLAMVSRYSKPDATLLRESFGAVISCKHQLNNLLVCPVKAIKSVVAMVPHSQLSAEVLGTSWSERVFVVEKPGLDIASMGGVTEEDEEEM